MKLGYTVWTWIIRLYEETHSWEPKSARSKLDFEEALKSLSFLGYDSIECFNQIVEIYQDADEEFDKVVRESKLSFDCIYIYLTDDFNADKQNAETCFKFMQRHRIPYANLQASSRSGETLAPKELVDEIEKACILGRLGRQYDVTVCLHPHLGTKIEREEEIEMLDRLAPKEDLAFVLDTAHIHAAGMDVVSMFEKYAHRIRYVHLKDISKPEEMEATQFDRFRALGEGIIDFQALLGSLEKSGYDGILCVELDNPQICNFASAQQSISHLRQLRLCM